MGKHTVHFKNGAYISGVYSIVGRKESCGNIGDAFDTCLEDDYFGEKTFEKAECKMLATAIDDVIKKHKMKKSEIDAIISGDLLNQIISASFAAREFNIPYIGIYNACSTYVEGLALGAMMLDGGYMNNIVVGTGSHFATAERQYRYPLELGSTRPPQAQWTVTGAGASILTRKNDGLRITTATFGKVMDYGINDVNNMGAAMAPAAMDTIITHLNETQRTPEYYDLIVTGDLGALGSRILKHILEEKGVKIEKNHVDCGELIYNIDEEEFQGGSGAGCVAVVFNSYIHEKLKNKEINKILLVATGALLSTVTSQQGESIPAIAHAVSIEND